MMRFCRLALLVLGAAHAAPAQSTARTTYAVRVLDHATGAPVAGVEVVDVTSEKRVLTAADGRASLPVSRQDTAAVLLRKVGYQAQTLQLTAADSLAVTVPLRRLATLPAETVTVQGVSPELVHKLRMTGFFERRKASAAPSSSFITDADIARRKPMLVSDLLARYTFRTNCTTYLDGLRVQPGGGRGYRKGIDALLMPSDIAAIEVYSRASTVPAQFASISGGGCVILYWLK